MRRVCRANAISDERGAIMLIAVFFAIFMVGMLFLAIASGQTVLFRENLQDAADSAVLSAAVTEARVMNVLVLINIVMAILLSVLVALKLIQGIAIVGIAIAAGLAWFTGGASLAAIPPLNGLYSTMGNIYDQVEPSVFSALSTLKDVGDQLKDIAADAAESGAQIDIAENSKIANSGFVSITPNALPVEDDKYENLCGRAGRAAIEIANLPLRVVPPIAKLMGLLEGPMGTLAGALSEWFCGDGENQMPSISPEVDKGYPATEESSDCENDKSIGDYYGSDSPDEQPPMTETCRVAEAFKASAQPDAQGDCTAHCDPPTAAASEQTCTACDPRNFAKLAQAGRDQCNPSTAPAPRATRYQHQQMSVVYTWNGKAWLRGEPTVLKSELIEQDPKNSNVPPCGAPEFHPSVATGYLAKPGDDPTHPVPVCSTEQAPEVPADPSELEYLRSGANPSTVTVEYQQVPRIFGCVKKQAVPTKVAEGKQASDVDGNDKSPKRVKGVATLGSEAFQVRSVVFGNLEQREAARIVRLSLWKRHEPDNPLGRLEQFGGFATAQAEYFFASAGSAANRDEWMWMMNWRARLKRVAIPRGDDDRSAMLKDCKDQILERSVCDKMDKLLEEWNDLLVH
jgi:hypothetical protein